MVVAPPWLGDDGDHGTTKVAKVLHISTIVIKSISGPGLHSDA